MRLHSLPVRVLGLVGLAGVLTAGPAPAQELNDLPELPWQQQVTGRLTAETETLDGGEHVVRYRLSVPTEQGFELRLVCACLAHVQALGRLGSLRCRVPMNPPTLYLSRCGMQ